MPSSISPILPPMNDSDRQKLAYLLLLSWEKQLPLLATGSRVIGGATIDSDWDYVLLCEHWNRSLADAIESMGFAQTNNDDHSGDVYGNRMTYKTYRYGKLNLIVCRHRSVFDNWNRATEIAKALRPRTKEQRIQIFDSVFLQTSFFGHAPRVQEVSDDF